MKDFENSFPHEDPLQKKIINPIPETEKKKTDVGNALVETEKKQDGIKIQKNSKYFYETEKPSNFLTDSDEDFLTHPYDLVGSEKRSLQVQPQKHHEVFIKHDNIKYDDNLKLLQFKSKAFQNQKLANLKKNNLVLKNLFKKFETIKSGNSLEDLLT